MNLDSVIEDNDEIIVVHHDGVVLSRSALKAKVMSGLAQSGHIHIGRGAAGPEYLVKILADFLETHGVTVA